MCVVELCRAVASMGARSARGHLPPGNVVKCFFALAVTIFLRVWVVYLVVLACVVKSSTFFWGKKCTPEKILAVNLPTPGKKNPAGAYCGIGPLNWRQRTDWHSWRKINLLARRRKIIGGVWRNGFGGGGMASAVEYCFPLSAKPGLPCSAVSLR